MKSQNKRAAIQNKILLIILAWFSSSRRELKNCLDFLSVHNTDQPLLASHGESVIQSIDNENNLLWDFNEGKLKSTKPHQNDKAVKPHLTIKTLESIHTSSNRKPLLRFVKISQHSKKNKT